MAGEKRNPLLVGTSEGFPRRGPVQAGGIGTVSVRPKEYFVDDVAAGQGNGTVRPGTGDGRGSGIHEARQVVTKDSIREAMDRLKKYREGKANLEARVKEMKTGGACSSGTISRTRQEAGEMGTRSRSLPGSLTP